MKLVATVFENSLVLFLLEICDTGRCRESVILCIGISGCLPQG